MGLDVTHFMLTHNPNDTGNYFTIEDWDLDCNVPLKNYAKFIADVWEFEFDKIIAIVKNEKDLENLKKNKYYNEAKYIKHYVGTLNSKMTTDLARYIRIEKLDKLLKLEHSTMRDGINYREIAFGERVTKKGFYYDRIDSQERGMNDLFYDTFRKYELWGEKKDFDLALECVGGDWYIDVWGQEAVDKTKANFKANFVDKFVFGQSLLFVSF